MVKGQDEVPTRWAMMKIEGGFPHWVLAVAPAFLANYYAAANNIATASQPPRRQRSPWGNLNSPSDISVNLNGVL